MLCAGFEGLERVPSMFVLLGNFQSFSCNAASTDYSAVKDNFAALAEVISSFPRIKVLCATALAAESVVKQ